MQVLKVECQKKTNEKLFHLLFAYFSHMELTLIRVFSTPLVFNYVKMGSYLKC